MDLGIAGKWALVCGASKGLGFGCAQALALKPDDAVVHSALWFTLSQNEAVDAAALFAEHCRFGAQFEAPLRAQWQPHSNSRAPHWHPVLDLSDAALAEKIRASCRSTAWTRRHRR